MQYVEPDNLAAAIELLAADDARPLAGGATLVAMLNEGLLAPSRLVGLQRIGALSRFERHADGSVLLGAMCRHADVATHPALVGGHYLVREAAAQIAHPTIRNMGTIGGSVAHADPNADYPCALTAAGALVRIADARGERAVPIDGFFVDHLMTILEPGELITGIVLPPADGLESSVYLKFSRIDGDYATVSIGVRAGWSSDGRCRSLRLAVGSCHATPLRSLDAEQVLIDGDLNEGAVARAGELLVAASDPVDDFRGSASYRQMLIPGLLARALALARARQGEGNPGGTGAQQ